MISKIVEDLAVIEVEHNNGVIDEFMVIKSASHFIEFDLTGSVDEMYDTGDYYTPSYYEIEKVEIEIDNVLLFNSEGKKIDLNDNDLFKLKKALDDCIIII